VIIAILTCICLILSVLFFPKIKLFRKSIDTYWVVCLFGGVCVILFGGISLKEVFAGLTNNSSINPLKILVLFVSMTFLSVFLDEMGFFKYLATVATKKAKSNQLSLFLVLYFLVAVLTVFTSNDIVILTFTPFICYFAKNTKINPIPYLVAEFAAANTWSMMLIIGNPTNIYLATSAGIDFISYLKVMALPTLFAGVVEIGIILLLFRKALSAPLQIEVETVKLSDKPLTWIGIAHLLVCLVLLVIASYIQLDMW
jgi:arsenical pump membrane protein